MTKTRSEEEEEQICAESEFLQVKKFINLSAILKVGRKPTKPALQQVSEQSESGKGMDGEDGSMDSSDDIRLFDSLRLKDVGSDSAVQIETPDDAHMAF